MDRRWQLWGIVAAAALFFPGCWLFGGAPSGMPEKVFGIYNAFPEHPQYLGKRHPASGTSTGILEELLLKPRLTGEVIRFLEAKGYRAVAVEDPLALEAGEVDVLIQVLPLPVYRRPGMAAYGFSGRELLGDVVQQPAASFVALKVSMRRRFSSREVTTRPEERFSHLGGRDLPGSWEGLSQEEQKAFERNLSENMAKAVYLSMSRLKI